MALADIEHLGLTDFSLWSATVLAGHIWEMKDRAKDSTLVPNIKWQVMSTHKPYERGGRRCNLCLAEKTLIAKDVEGNLLNKRAEIANKCLHKLQHKLSQFIYTHIPPAGSDVNVPEQPGDYNGDDSGEAESGQQEGGEDNWPGEAGGGPEEDEGGGGQDGFPHEKQRGGKRAPKVDYSKFF